MAVGTATNSDPRTTMQVYIIFLATLFGLGQAVNSGLDEVFEALDEFAPDKRENVPGESPPKIIPGSEMDELQERVIEASINILTLSVEQCNEGRVTELATKAVQVKRNLRAAGFQNQSEAPEMENMAASCKGALPIRCYEKDRFRTISGICNNLEHPYWGSAAIKMRRFVPPQYADGFQEPRGGRRSAARNCDVTGNQKEEDECPASCSTDAEALLPNPRFVSSEFHPDFNEVGRVNALFTQFAQLLDHDLTLAPEEEAEGCCQGASYPGSSGRQGSEDSCFPIEIPCKDKCFSLHKPLGELGRTNCLAFFRSEPFCGENEGVREQFNAITAFVDASNVYGSSVETANKLRSFYEGQMLTSHNDLLPIFNGEVTAGDVRSPEQAGLTSIHTIFLREHNRLAKELAQMNLPGCGDEEIFQQARRILVAEMQVIVYNQFLPILLPYNVRFQHKLDIKLGTDPIWKQFNTYNPNRDPSIKNAFAAAAYRFGHSLLQSLIPVLALQNRTNNVDIGTAELRNNFFNLDNYFRDNGRGMEEIMFGTMAQQALESDRFFIDDVTTFLFSNIDQIGSDLVARNIQRGRDHGLGSYNDYREFCHLGRSCSWSDRPQNIPVDAWAQLRTIYDSPNDIDLFVGGFAEQQLPGGMLGHTFSCLVAKQFADIKFGDRFFFSFPTNPSPFTTAQAQHLLTRNLGDIICDNTDVPGYPKHFGGFGTVPEFFFRNIFNNLFVMCGNHNKLDLDLLINGPTKHVKAAAPIANREEPEPADSIQTESNDHQKQMDVAAKMETAKRNEFVEKPVEGIANVKGHMKKHSLKKTEEPQEKMDIKAEHHANRKHH